MASPLQSLIATGTKLWLDSVDPDLVRANRALGATGATSNPIIISDLIKTGRFDDELGATCWSTAASSDDDAAWQLTDSVVRDAQDVFLPVWKSTRGDDGYVSFELDPLLEDPGCTLSHDERVARYIELGRRWSAGHENRMIKVPATPAGLDALEELCRRRRHAQRDADLHDAAVRSGARRDLARRAAAQVARRFKSVYSIFISRVDVYTEKHVPELVAGRAGQVGIVGAKRIWQANQEFWATRPTPLQQEIIFASTGTKKPEDPPWKYVIALAGSDIQTNPPATNDAVESKRPDISAARSIKCRRPTCWPKSTPRSTCRNWKTQLMREGVAKFADPQKALLKLLARKARLAGRTPASLTSHAGCASSPVSPYACHSKSLRVVSPPRLC